MNEDDQAITKAGNRALKKWEEEQQFKIPKSYAKSISERIESRPYNAEGVKDGNYNYLHVNDVVKIITQILQDGVLV